MFISHATSFPGSLLFTPQEAREGRPWLGLVTCLPKYGRLQIIDWREGRLSVSLPILSVPGMGKHFPSEAKELLYGDALPLCKFLPHLLCRPRERTPNNFRVVRSTISESQVSFELKVKRCI